MSDQAEENLFDCFGDDNDDDDSDANSDMGNGRKPLKETSTVKSPITPADAALRAPACGVLSFHNGTEQSLWNFVERELESSEGLDKTEKQAIPTGRKILQLVDHFCYSRHWMMNLGDEKGKCLAGFLREFCEEYKQQLLCHSSKETPVSMVELGTYCGYSAMLIALTLLEMLPSANFHIFSVDVESGFQQIARKFVHKAGLSEYITLILIPLNPTEDSCLAKTLQQGYGINCIDFLFIDHDKDLYCSDLKQLEQSGLIHPGTHVAADNVIFFDICYRSYIRQLEEEGVVKSRLVKTQLEYFIDGELEDTPEEFEDGIEFSIYLKDPRHRTGVDKLT